MTERRAEGHSLSRGDRLGPYEIVELLGSGGMGDVYRARDPRFGRDVAIKVLRESARDSVHIATVTREARAAGSLNHPNIVAVYDVGSDGDVPYLVEEFLDGETLRMRLDRGAVPFRKAIDYAIQIGQGLASAHAKGIWHRDVKPANIFITKDGHVKLLDFGLAKAVEQESTLTISTGVDQSYSGRVVGTAGYMSPEQVRGLPVDHRTDIFALGAVLYELFTGMRAFKRPSTIETMNAILNEEPLDPLAANTELPAAAAALVRRCLEKDREERFQSARDLVFALQQLRDPSSGSLPQGPRQFRRTRIALAVVATALLLILAALVAMLLRRDPAPAFEQLTFHRGRIGGARFASDGRAVVYSGTRDTTALEVSRIDLADSPQSRPLNYPASSDVLAARSGEFALSVRRSFLLGERFTGTLAIAPAAGGASPREVAENVEDADWDPSGTRLALVKSTGDAGGQSWIEYNGQTMHTTAGSIRFLRVSRDGERLAFWEDPTRRGSSGNVVTIDLRTQAATQLTGNWENARGLAWSPGGDEVWFTAANSGFNRALRAVNLEGEQRLVFEGPGSLTLWDVSPDGRALLTRDEQRRSIVGVPPGETAERDFSSFDESALADLSADGRWILFKDRFGVFLRETTGSQLINLGQPDAFVDQISPDGRTVLGTLLSPPQLILIPTGPGQPRPLPTHGIAGYNGAFWFPDGQSIFFSGSMPGRPLRSYVQPIADGTLRPLTPEGTRAISISPDGQWVAAIGPEEGISLFPIAGGRPRPVKGSQRGDRPVAFSADGRSLWLFRRGEVPTHVDRLDIATGRRELWKTLLPPDPAGVYSIIEFKVTPTGHSYFYSYTRLLSQLFLVTGLK